MSPNSRFAQIDGNDEVIQIWKFLETFQQKLKLQGTQRAALASPLFSPADILKQTKARLRIVLVLAPILNLVYVIISCFQQVKHFGRP
jgi:hypothetical protein